MTTFKSHWSKKQQDRLAALMEQGVWIGYHCSDEHGCPSHGSREVKPIGPGWKQKFKPVRPGLKQKLKGFWPEYGEKVFSATRVPHRWVGTRVWMVALHGEVKEDSDKVWGLKREILGEIKLEEAYFDPGVAVRLRLTYLRLAS